MKTKRKNLNKITNALSVQVISDHLLASISTAKEDILSCSSAMSLSLAGFSSASCSVFVLNTSNSTSLSGSYSALIGAVLVFYTELARFDLIILAIPSFVAFSNSFFSSMNFPFASRSSNFFLAFLNFRTWNVPS